MGVLDTVHCRESSSLALPGSKKPVPLPGSVSNPILKQGVDGSRGAEDLSRAAVGTVSARLVL
jgi:hypothetical protein